MLHRNFREGRTINRGGGATPFFVRGSQCLPDFTNLEWKSVTVVDVGVIVEAKKIDLHDCEHIGLSNNKQGF